MLSPILTPIQMITYCEIHVAGFSVNACKVNFIDVFDGHMLISRTLDFYVNWRNFRAARKSRLTLAHDGCLVLLHLAENLSLVWGESGSRRTLAFYTSNLSRHAIPGYKIEPSPSSAGSFDGNLAAKFKFLTVQCRFRSLLEGTASSFIHLQLGATPRFQLLRSCDTAFNYRTIDGRSFRWLSGRR
jgi:hypothetical protein